MINRISQKDRILRALERQKSVGVPQLLRMGIASHTKRISELREDGYKIVNYINWNAKKKQYESRYVLTYS